MKIKVPGSSLHEAEAAAEMTETNSRPTRAPESSKSTTGNSGWRTRRTWLALYAMDTTTVEERTAFLERIRTRVAAM